MASSEDEEKSFYQLERVSDLTAGLVSSVDRDMKEERWTDLVLYSSEGAAVPVHRAILSQSTLLRPLLTSLSCCQGRCANQEPLSVLLPDFSYRLLLTAVKFLYTGTIICRRQEMQPLKVGCFTVTISDRAYSLLLM